MADAWMYQPSPTSNADQSPRRSSSEGQPNLSAFRDSTTSPPEANNTQKNGRVRIRRRNRIITSCLECRRRKLKCDKQAPCTNCTRFKRDCLYLAPALDPQSQQKLADIKEKMGALEKNLEREVVSKHAKMHPGGANVTRTPNAGEPSYTHVSPDDEDESGLAAEDEETLEPTPLAALDNVYEDGGDDELMDLGVQMGKMRISERIGGWIRPKLVDELNDTLKDVTGGKSRQSSTPMPSDPRDSRNEQTKIQASPKSYIGPGPDYIAPAASFFFPGTNMNTTLLDYLPSKSAADQLIAQYFNAVHYVARIVHRPTLEAQYTLFWGCIATGSEPAPSMQAIIFAAMFSAAVSLDDVQVTRQFGTSKASLIDSLRSGSEMALAKANFLRTTKVDTMQAFVMYLIPLVRAEVSRAHSALVGTAIRLAECMGLHRDGLHYGMAPVETHVRRMIWHQLCFLDMRTCEATGPRPQIRKDDYDTQFPLNVDDADLLNASNPPTQDSPHWTDMTLMRIRAECMDLRRGLWYDVVQVDRKKKSLTSVLVKIQKTRQAIESQFLPMTDPSIPFHTFARHVMALGIFGCFIQVLHRYLFSTSTRMPDRLRQILIESGLEQMENAIALETKHELAPWAWYKGAFNQYHSALLMMVEVYAYPMRKDAPRIWKCLDYIFDIPAHLSPKQKAELVITDLRDRMEVYHQMRKLRSTTQMEERVSSLNKSSIVRDSNTKAAVEMINAVSKPGKLSSGNANSPMNQGSFSPPLANTAESVGSDRQGNVAAGNDTMMTMEDIDWAEWDKYFPIEQNTGDLNIPDFDIAAFTGGFNTPANASQNPSQTYPAPNDGITIPSVNDLANMNFGSAAQTFYGNIEKNGPTFGPVSYQRH
nr:bikaverin cluster transcription factor bik5 [Quercus suber]